MLDFVFHFKSFRLYFIFPIVITIIIVFIINIDCSEKFKLSLDGNEMSVLLTPVTVNY